MNYFSLAPFPFYSYTISMLSFRTGSLQYQLSPPKAQNLYAVENLKKEHHHVIIHLVTSRPTIRHCADYTTFSFVAF